MRNIDCLLTFFSACFFIFLYACEHFAAANATLYGGSRHGSEQDFLLTGTQVEKNHREKETKAPALTSKGSEVGNRRTVSSGSGTLEYKSAAATFGNNGKPKDRQVEASSAPFFSHTPVGKKQTKAAQGIVNSGLMMKDVMRIATEAGKETAEGKFRRILGQVFSKVKSAAAFMKKKALENPVVKRLMLPFFGRVFGDFKRILVPMYNTIGGPVTTSVKEVFKGLAKAILKIGANMAMYVGGVFVFMGALFAIPLIISAVVMQIAGTIVVGILSTVAEGLTDLPSSITSVAVSILLLPVKIVEGIVALYAKLCRGAGSTVDQM